MSYDLLISNGLIVDGSGLACYPADLAVSGDRIAAIGRIRGTARRVIDARGQVVSPGFIDGHTHMDAQLHWDPLGSCSCWHGVTTVVMGNCGFTLAPARAAARDLVVRNLERAEDISPVAMAAGIKWEWETFPEYLEVLERLPKGINYAANVGHSALRTWVMGERAFESEASGDEVRQMEDQLRAGLRAGALGLTTSRNSNHETSDNRPVASRLASWEELCRLVNVVGAEDGIFELAPEDAAPDPKSAAAADARLKELAVQSGATVTFGTLGVDRLALLDATAAAGGRMVGQCHSRGISILLSFETQLPFDRLPEWSKVRARPLAEQKTLLRDPALRARLVHEANLGPYGRAIGAEARKPDWSTLRVYQNPLPPNPLVSELAAQRGVDPVELMIDLALERDFKQFFQSFSTAGDDATLLAVMRHPRTVMTFSDSGAHVSQIVDSCIQTHLLAYWVRQRGAFSLEEAVRMVTLAPARAWGFHDRGLLRTGMIADINIFDPATLSPEMPEVAHDLPGGARRLTMRARGFRANIVAGEVLLENGQHTGRLPGRLLRSAAVQ
jgi:N-acyl-D-aspartate/D-glutamate deacylase